MIWIALYAVLCVYIMALGFILNAAHNAHPFPFNDEDM